MSRVPVEDCLDRIPNRFHLCAVAAKRARQLARGAPSQLSASGHKSTVQSLLEIAVGQVGVAVLDEADLPIEEPIGMTFEAPDMLGS